MDSFIPCETPHLVPTTYCGCTWVPIEQVAKSQGVAEHVSYVSCPMDSSKPTKYPIPNDVLLHFSVFVHPSHVKSCKFPIYKTHFSPFSKVAPLDILQKAVEEHPMVPWNAPWPSSFSCLKTLWVMCFGLGNGLPDFLMDLHVEMVLGVAPQRTKLHFTPPVFGAFGW